MLTKSLLKGRILDGVLKPTYITKKNTLGFGVSEELVLLTKRMNGKSFVAFKKSIDEAGLSVNPYVPGLMKVIKDHFIDLEEIDYEKLRWELIKASESERAGATSYEQFQQRMADRFNMDFNKLSLSIYGDLDEEVPISVKVDLNREALVQKYNLDLAKGFLVKAENISVQVKGHSSELKKIFSRIKFLGLFVENLCGDESGFRFQVSGPLSMTTGVKAYGVKFVGLLSVLSEFDNWSLEAEITHNSKKAVLNLDQKSPIKSEKKALKSSEYIPENIRAILDLQTKLDLDWKLEASCEMLNFGSEQYCFPDVKAFSSDGEVRYIELFNKWNSRALLSRLEQLETCSDMGVYLGIDRTLTKDKKISKKLEKNKLSQSFTFLYRDVPSSKALKSMLKK